MTSTENRLVPIQGMDSRKRSRFNWQVEEGSKCLFPDIMTIILARLPLSSLARFRSVSKKWLAIITHDGILNNGYKTGSPSILIHTRIRIRTTGTTVCDDDIKERNMSQLTLIDPDGRNKRVCHLDDTFTCISPSYNGLFCIYNCVSISLFNPTTRQELPLPPLTEGHNKKWHKRNRCLLGYSPTTKEYKVLHFFWGRDDTQNCEDPKEL